MRILISGTPGTGKSEVADALGKKLKIKVVHVSEIVDGFSAGFDSERKTKTVDEGKLSNYLRKLDDVIIETHLPVEVDAECFVLKCDINELRKRLKKRGWKKKKIDENVQAEIFDICSDDLKEKGYTIIEIDTCGKTADEVAENIKCILGS